MREFFFPCMATYVLSRSQVTAFQFNFWARDLMAPTKTQKQRRGNRTPGSAASGSAAASPTPGSEAAGSEAAAPKAVPVQVTLSNGLVVEVYGFGNNQSDFIRPCVDCGEMTGSFCENECLASARLPNDQWQKNQPTPHCTSCDQKFGCCHFCRGTHWAAPPPWRSDCSANARKSPTPGSD